MNQPPVDPFPQTAAFLAAVLENLSEGVVACNADGVLTTFNRATREFHNIADATIPADEWASKYSLYRSDGITPMTTNEVPLVRALAGEVIRDVELVIVSSQQKRTVLCNGNAIYDHDGKKLGAVIAMRDISEFKKASDEIEKVSNRLESEKRFRTLFEQNPLSVQLLSVEGRTLQVNAAWKALWGLTEEFVQSYILKEYNMLQDPQLVEKGIMPVIEAGFKGRGGKIPAIYYDTEALGEGRGRWVEGFIDPILDNDGNVKEVVLIHQDVTEKIYAEQDLRKARDEAQEGNRLKSAFLANMSHEIRTPLSAILGFSQLLKDPSIPRDEADEYLAIIDRSGKALTRIIDDILDLSKVEAGRLQIETTTVDISDIIVEVSSLFRKQAFDKGIALSTSNETSQTVVQTDPARLRQILINLVGNALKFTQHGEVTIKVQVTKHEPRSNLKVSVIDTGLGISKVQQAELFQPFNQVDSSRTRQFGGTGLGLVLSRRLAEAMGGDVYLEKSIPGSGSTFVVSLPLGEHAKAEVSKQQTQETEPTVSASLSGLSMLVVDDSADNRTLLKRILDKEGIRVFEASHGAEAVMRGLQDSFDLILMDVQMPIMDGFEAIRTLRAKGYTRPIIALTAHAMNEERNRCLAVGADAHFAKPIDTKKLLALIHTLVH